jgi:hypothetical protein
MAQISKLSQVISSSVGELLALSATNGWVLPALNEPFDPVKNVFRGNPDAANAATKIIAAAMQLATTLMTPRQAIRAFAAGVQLLLPL